MAKRKGHSVHPFYYRWMVIRQRCYSVNSRDYRLYGGRGIKMAEEWQPGNSRGAINFYEWLERALMLLGVEDVSKVDIGRRDRDGDYSPDNCVLRTRIETQIQRRNVTLTRDCVIGARKLAKKRHDLTVREIAIIYNCSQEAMTSALRGRTWKSINHIEAPCPVNWNGKNLRLNNSF